MAKVGAFKKYGNTDGVRAVSAAKKTGQTQEILPIQTKQELKMTPRTYKIIDEVLEAMEDKFYHERLSKKGMNYQKYVNDLIYRDTHNGEPLYDYNTGELLVEL